MGHSTIWGLMALACCLGASQATAGNGYPATGLVQGIVENSALQYDCKLQGDTLECEFTRTSVTRKNKPAGEPRRFEKPQRVYFSNKQPTVQECNGYRQLISALKNGRAPVGIGQGEFEEGIAWFASVDGEDFQAVASFFSEYCRQPARQHSIKVLRPNRNRNARSCSISTKRFTRRFSKQPNSDIWVAFEASPEHCGSARRDRFVLEDDDAGNSNWSYFTNTTISYNSDNTWAGRKCTNTTTIESKYEWRPRNLQLDCDTISFSLF